MPRRAILASLVILTLGFGHGAEAIGADSSLPPEVSTTANAAAEIDRRLADELFVGLQAGEQLAPRVSDEIVLRRLYLDLVGTAPTPDEIKLFVADQAAGKRSAKAAALLNDPRFGVNVGNYWRDVLLARQNTVGEGPTAAVEALEVYLARSFNDNVPWDKLVRSFIVAVGPASDHGETAIYLAQRVDAAEVASEMSRLFLGIQIQCAQCHDHPTDRWKRKHFHEFAAFFPRAGVKRFERMPGGRGEPQIAAFDDGPMERTQRTRFVGLREHLMFDPKAPDKPGVAVTPAFFLTGQRLEADATDERRRQALAEWMTTRDNPWFAKAFVNRTWAELVGEGFYEPVDDMGPDRRASAPRTLDYLAGQFAERNCDVKWLYLAIVQTEAYQRESRPRRAPEATPFTANVSQPLRAEQMIAVLSQAVGVDVAGPRKPLAGQGQVTLGQRSLLHGLFGYDPSIRREEVSASIPQALLLMNSEALNRTVTAQQSGSKLFQLLAAAPTDEQAVIDLYLQTLSRRPNAREQAICLEFVANVGNRAEAFEDLFWSLLNSEELRFRN